MLTGGWVADCKAGAEVKCLPDTRIRGTMPNILPKANRRWKDCFSPVLYRDQNDIERMFCRLKDVRMVATRYDRLAVSFLFLAAVCIAVTVSYWL